MTSMDGGNAGNAGAVGSADSFIYGENNRLKEAGIGGSPLATYSYNGRGERVKKLGTATTYYYYDSNGQLIAELDGSGNTVREYVYLDGQPLALVTGGNIYTIHTDHLGTPQVITDVSQTVVWQADYKPFGEANITIETITNNLRLPGQYFDGETGLHYNYFRDYDPSTGRYIESDPIGLGGGINIYGYVLANPIVNIDLMGLARGGRRGIRGRNKGGNRWASPNPSGNRFEPNLTGPTANKDAKGILDKLSDMLPTPGSENDTSDCTSGFRYWYVWECKSKQKYGCMSDYGESIFMRTSVLGLDKPPLGKGFECKFRGIVPRDWQPCPLKGDPIIQQYRKNTGWGSPDANWSNN